MMDHNNGFHPDLPLNRVYHITSLSSDTAKTDGMRRFAAISGASAGAEKLWMGETHVAPLTASGNHHHGDSETAIYVRRGHPEFVFHDGEREVRVSTNPGDYVFVPPYVPHREENPHPSETAEIVIARSSQEAIVINVPRLYALGDSR
jgi:uncharacterized RmlC-like cupin family protein